MQLCVPVQFKCAWKSITWRLPFSRVGGHERPCVWLPASVGKPCPVWRLDQRPMDMIAVTLGHSLYTAVNRCAGVICNTSVTSSMSETPPTDRTRSNAARKSRCGLVSACRSADACTRNENIRCAVRFRAQPPPVVSWCRDLAATERGRALGRHGVIEIG